MRELGISSLIFSLLFSILGIGFYIYGFYKKDERYIKAFKRSLTSSIFLIIISSISLIYLLLTKDYEIEYVANYVNNTLSLIYTFSSFWAGMEGSLLFWILILGIYTLFLFYKNKDEKIDHFSYFFLNFIFIFFLVLIIFFANPFKKLPFKISDGQGLNPLLQNFWMLLHPPFLYFGYIGFTIPFVYTISYLFLKEQKFPENIIRKWSLFSWLFLSIGILTGGRWAYVELGWGGYWAWDPVENASLLPWLTGSAFLHTSIISKRENILKRWNIFLIFLTFLLTIIGTYITRSGIISSVHAFSEAKISPPFIFFLIIIILFFLYLFIKNYKFLEGEKKIENIMTFEGNFYLLSLILLFITLIIFIGTFFPIISEILILRKISLSASFYNIATAPFFTLILLMIGICQNLKRREFKLKEFFKKIYVSFFLTIITSFVLIFLGIKKFYPLFISSISFFFLYSFLINLFKDIKIKSKILLKYSPNLIHLGIMITGIGISISNSYKIKKDFEIYENEEIKIEKFILSYKGIEFFSNPHYDYAVAKIDVYENNKFLGSLKPEIRFYKNYENPISEIDIIPVLKGDIYLILKGWDKEKGYFEFHFNPLINFVWYGIIFIIFGGTILIFKK
jgi:cytochrome c-type biogenesis protein CcmF